MRLETGFCVPRPCTRLAVLTCHPDRPTDVTECLTARCPPPVGSTGPGPEKLGGAHTARRKCGCGCGCGHAQPRARRRQNVREPRPGEPGAWGRPRASHWRAKTSLHGASRPCPHTPITAFRAEATSAGDPWRRSFQGTSDTACRLPSGAASCPDRQRRDHRRGSRLPRRAACVCIYLPVLALGDLRPPCAEEKQTTPSEHLMARGLETLHTHCRGEPSG